MSKTLEDVDKALQETNRLLSEIKDDKKIDLDPVTATFIITIIEMALRHGVPWVIDIIKTWTMDEEVTVEKIVELKTIMKDPSSYFDSKDED